MRVLVTGSRSWTDSDAVQNALLTAAIAAINLAEPVTITHGAARRGVDAYANRWARRRGYPVVNDPHPADWTGPCRSTCRPGHRRAGRGAEPSVCPAAGMYRNADMVTLGADLCVAFIAACTDPNCPRRGPHGSHGASACADLAERAGIQTVRLSLEVVAR